MSAPNVLQPKLNSLRAAINNISHVSLHGFREQCTGALVDIECLCKITPYLKFNLYLAKSECNFLAAECENSYKSGNLREFLVRKKAALSAIYQLEIALFGAVPSEEAKQLGITWNSRLS